MAFCNDYHFLEGVRIISFVITVLRIIIPILLIGFGSYDYFQTVINPDKAPATEKTQSFVLRLISAFMIFMLPTIINLVFSVVSNFGGSMLVLNDCLKNANKGYIDQLKIASKKQLEEYEQTGQNYQSKYNPEKYKNVGKNGELLEVADRLWKQIVNGNFTYGGTPIPPTTTVDCSAFVTWVLNEYGYAEEFSYQHNTANFKETNWQEKFGWEEIDVAANEDVTAKLKAGDILVRDIGGAGHMNIIASVEVDGTVMAYDCGSASNWKNSDGGPVAKNDFAKSDSRPGKIIRVKK